MFQRVRLSLFSAGILLSLLLSLVLPVTVYADDAAPPAEAPAAESPPVDAVTTDTASTDAAPSDTPSTDVVATAEAPVAETTAVDEGSTGAVAAAEPAAVESTPVESATTTAESTQSLPEVLAQMPEDTQVVVLDENGESVPLATSEAAEILAAGDPLWCPSGVAPNPTIGGCSAAFASIGALVASPFVVTGNGTIWVQSGPALAAAVIGTGFNWASYVNFSLTIQGGWNGTPGSMALDPVNPISTFSGMFTDLLWIKGWVGAITLKNLKFNSWTYANPGVNYDTLTVQTQGNIVLDKVQVLNANNSSPAVGDVARGATLDNTTGSGSVTVTNGVFTNNEGRGLSIFSKGAVTLKNVDADYNQDTGVWIVNDAATTAKPVTVTNAEFKGNNFIGLDLRSKGAVTLTNLVATYNTTGDGVYVINTSGTAAVTINGVNNFSNNGWDGLEVWSKGLIRVSNTTANYNLYDGVYLNLNGTQPVTILGFLTAMYNGWDGLGIDCLGAVTAANLTLSYNTGASGAYINNTWGPTSAPKPVTITGTNFFNDNKAYGLYLFSHGAITLSSINAIHNGIGNDLPGVYLQNNYLNTAPQNVTISGTNVFNYNSKHGLEVYSFGAITLSNVTASYNWYDAASGAGVYLDNKTGASLAKPVTLSGVNSFTWNDQEGLYILSKGAVTLNKITATYNGLAGVLVDNNGSPTFSGVTGIGYLTALNNYYGLLVNSDGAVKFSNLTTKNNSGYGATINNTTPGTPKPVTLTGTNLFADNDYNGLYIASEGAVTLSNITALHNGIPNNYSGVYIYNEYNSGVPQNVTISGYNVFSNNSKHGLEVHSYGAITLSNVTAEYNYYDALDGAGVYLDNNNGTLARPVTLSGVNLFTWNDDEGLYIESLGAVTLSKITAKFNSLDGADGVYVNNTNLLHFQSKISVLGYGLFENNSQDGVDLNSNGAISLANVSANYNSDYGAQLWTMGLTAPQAVTLSGYNNFIGNGDAGLESGLLVNADGNITVSNINASYNFYRGADLDNWNNWNDHTPEPNFATYGSVTLTGFGNFIGNVTDSGLYINTHGSATVNRATADKNGWRGLEIFSDHNITLVCSSAYGNFGRGVWANINLPYILTLKGWYSYGNGIVDYYGVTPVVTLCP